MKSCSKLIRQLVMLFVLATSCLMVSGSALAECNHSWCVEYYDYEYVSDSVCQKMSEYWCQICDERKTVTENMSHSFDYGDVYYTQYNASQHICTESHYCMNCDHTIDEDSYEDHYWYVDDSTDYKPDPSNRNQHYYERSLICGDCGAGKKETITENHNWILIMTDMAIPVSGTQHSVTKHYQCNMCGTVTKYTSKGNHKYDKYGICKYCSFGRANAVALKSTVGGYGNNNTWFQITVPKNGYIVVNKMASCQPFDLYNMNKRVYKLQYFSTDRAQYIPVTKGTYYIRSKNVSSKYGTPIYMKYTFMADPSKQNYTMRTALSLKAKTKVTSVIYSSAKTNTWKRYFKVSLPKKQYLRVNSILPPASNGYLTLYDARGKAVSWSYFTTGTGGLVSTKQLNKGTYYICFQGNWNAVDKYSATGAMCQIYWQ